MENAFTVTSGPGTSSSMSASPFREASTAAAIAPASSARSSTTANPFWPWRSTGFTTAGKGSPSSRRGGHRPARLGDVELRKAPPLPVLEDGQRCGLGRNGVRQACVGGDAGGDGHGPVDSRGDEAVHPLSARQLADRRFVLDGHHRAAVGVLEADGGRVAVARDDVEPALPCGPVQPKLSRPGSEN